MKVKYFNLCTFSVKKYIYEVSMESGRIESWDQGFDANGKQVWGAEKGGYVFLKQN